MRDDQIVNEEYYELQVNGAFYDYYTSLSYAEEIAGMLIKDYDIQDVDIWHIIKQSELVKEYDSCG